MNIKESMRLILWLSALFLLVTIAEVKAGDFTYTTNADNTLTITKYTGLGGSVIIPPSIEGRTVTSIGDSAFEFYRNLTSVMIPDSVTNIGVRAFYVCSSLTSVTIPDSVATIGELAFADCANLTAITVSTGNSVYSSLAGVLFNKSQTTLVQYPNGKTGNSYMVPDSVTSIGNGAFHFSRLASVTLSDNVTSIGYSMFFFCTNLTSVMIPNSVTSIGGGAFYYCTSLTSVTIPDGVTSIEDATFYSCNNLMKVIIGAGVNCIKEYAFAFCGNLKGVYFKGNVPSITGAVILGNYQTTVYYLPGTTGWGSTFRSRPTMPWIPLVTANGQLEDVQINSGESLEIAVQTTDVGGYSGVAVDWWVLADANSSWYYLNNSGRWVPFDGNPAHCQPVRQGGLFDLPPTAVLHTTELPVGSYTFWFAVSYPMNGILDLNGQVSHYSVDVTVK